MAAYAAVVCLMNTVDQIQNHPRHSFSFDSEQIESLREKLGFLQDFLECNSHGAGSEEAQVLESQITAAAYAAEDVIESHVVDQIHSGSTLGGKTSSYFLVDLQRVIEGVDSVKHMAMDVEAQRGLIRDQIAIYSKPSVSSRTPTTRKDAMVGFDDELIFQLKDALTGQRPTRQIISIVGMGGIGEQLHKYLSGRRYLIVLDDIWSVEAWDEIQLFLPDNDNGSRIVITTRLTNMADQICSSSFIMNFLEDDESWELFCENAFGEEGCPPEFEEIALQIVENCRGLPLSIVVIGGYLKKSPRTKEYWLNVAKNMGSFLNSAEDELCFKILSLSYNHLPVYLKPCFLYMGIFPEDKHIWVPDLINLWVAEGFLKPNRSQSLEEIAEDYLHELIDRNLLLFRGWGQNWKIETCYIHDLLRELCLKVGANEKFFCERRVIIHGKIPDQKSSLDDEVFDSRTSSAMSLVRSVKCEGGQLCFELRLLRVLNDVDSLIEANFQLLNLRYLCLSDRRRHPIFELPSSIFLLWNLQTLKIRVSLVTVPCEIWEMPQLRHLEFIMTHLPDPLPREEGGIVSGNLHTLKGVKNLKLSEEVCKRMANIKEVDVLYIHTRINDCDEGSSYCRFHSLGFGGFQKLETLSLKLICLPYRHYHLLGLTFPSSLKDLDLFNPHLCWED
ncbi:hypothetical protein C2S51_006776, partial [Perilla frutescens var. frutescens]